MEFTAFLSFDKAVFQWIEETFFNSGIGAFLSPFFSTITHLGDGGVFWIALAVVLLIFKKTRKIGLMVAGGIVCMALFNDVIIKPIVARPRPFDLEVWKDWFVYPELIARPDSFSFPSGHTSCSFAAATCLVTSKKKSFYIPGFIVAFLIGFSRIYIHVHYCTDVIFGALAGVIYGLIAIFVVTLIVKFVKTKTKWKIFD